MLSQRKDGRRYDLYRKESLKKMPVLKKRKPEEDTSAKGKEMLKKKMIMLRESKC